MSGGRQPDPVAAEPICRRAARRLARFTPGGWRWYDDFLSECRLAVVAAAAEYDATRHGEWERFACGRAWEAGQRFARRQVRRHGFTRCGVGRYEVVPPPASVAPDGRPIVDDAPDLRESRTVWTEAEWAAALAPLSPDRRRIVELVYREGLSERAVVAVVGMCRKTVRDRLRRSRPLVAAAVVRAGLDG